MCESNAYFRENDMEELLLKDVVKLVPKPGGKIYLENLIGEEKEITGTILEIDFSGHRILIKK